MDTGLIQQIVDDVTRITSVINYQDDKIHVIRSGEDIAVEVKFQDGAVRVFEKAGGVVSIEREGEWIIYLTGITTPTTINSSTTPDSTLFG